MPLLCYESKNFRAASIELIQQANEILAEYKAAGYMVNLRQLYYQFVSRDLLENTQKNYKRLGSVISDARRAGYIDWDMMEDRTRKIESNPHWKTPQELLQHAARWYMFDMWKRQTYRPIVLVEKEALIGVIENLCEELDVPYAANRGYPSDSMVWKLAWKTMRPQIAVAEQKPIVLHFGDHDPSGVDMTRDLEERLTMFSGKIIQVVRVALNMDQVEEYDPPPNPAKWTDTRAEGYVHQYGEQAWELDALSPQVIADLVRHNVEQLIDEPAWSEDHERLEEEKATIQVIADNWDDIEDEYNC